MKDIINLPKEGFYYHYKHNPLGAVNNYAYEVVGTGLNTEGDLDSEDLVNAYSVVYRPLYDIQESYWRGKNFFWLRPLKMFMEDVTKDSETFPRFSKITDEKVIKELNVIKQKMYE